MKRFAKPWMAWSLFVLTVAGWTGAAVLDTPPFASGSDQVWAFSFLAFPIVGLILATRRPINIVGWLFLFGPALVGAGLATLEATHGQSGDSVFGVGLLVMSSSMILFPDGRYPARSMAWAHAGVALWILLETLVLETDSGSGLTAMLALVIAALAVRLIREGPIVRRQIAWPVMAFLTGALTATVLAWLAPHTSWDVAGFVTITAGVPIAIGFSIFKYRLYDIDRIINRTVVYTVVVASVFGVYAGGVALLTTVLPSSNQLAVAGSTLAAAAVFAPLRRWVRSFVDSRFYRRRYDVQRVGQSLAVRLRDEVEVDEVASVWAAAVSNAVKPASMSVWVRSS